MKNTVYNMLADALPVIRELIDPELNNIVIGGTCALILHDLKLGRKIDDIDIIIYKPTPDQLKKLAILNLVDTTEYYGKNKRSIKFKYHVLNVNVLIDHSEVPSKLLLINVDDTLLQIQDIGNVIAAKNSYSVEDGTYRRLKDMRDCMNLKNNNFNL